MKSVNKSEDFKRELVTILFAQQRVIIATTLLIFGCAVMIAFFWPPTYSSQGSVLVKIKKPVKSPEEVEGAIIHNETVSQQDLTSEVEMLVSHDVIEKTLAQLEKKNIRPFKETFSPLGALSELLGRLKSRLTSSQKEYMNRAVLGIKQNIQTVVVPTSHVIEVTFKHRDPKYAVVFLDTLLDTYVAYRMQVYYPTETKDFFVEQVGSLNDQLEKKRLGWIDTIEKNRIADPAGELSNNLQMKNSLASQVATLESSAIERKASINYLDQALSKKGIQFFSFINSLSINSLGASLQRMVSEYGTLLRTYRPESDKARPVEKQLIEDLTLLRAEVKAYRDNQAYELEAMNQKIVKMRQYLLEISDRNVELQKQNITNQKINIEMDLLKASYGTFAKRMEEAVHGGPVSSYLTVLSRAFPSDGPIFPKKGVVIPMGLIVGFVTGCCFGFIREYFDHTFKQISQVERYAGIPVIFSISAPEEEKRKAKDHVSGLFGSRSSAVVTISAVLIAFSVLLPDTSQALRREVKKTVRTTIAFVGSLLSDDSSDGEPIRYIEDKKSEPLRRGEAVPQQQENNDAALYEDGDRLTQKMNDARP